MRITTIAPSAPSKASEVWNASAAAGMCAGMSSRNTVSGSEPAQDSETNMKDQDINLHEKADIFVSESSTHSFVVNLSKNGEYDGAAWTLQ